LLKFVTNLKLIGMVIFKRENLECRQSANNTFYSNKSKLDTSAKTIKFI